MLNVQVDIASNLARVREAIGEAAERAGRQPHDITLVGVSKTHSAEDIAAAVRAGVRHIAENRVQEAAEKFPALASVVADATVRHMIGHLQTNKAGQAVELFDRVDSVDSLKLAQALARRVADGAELPILIEVYGGDDASRPGLRPLELVDVVGQVLEVRGLRVEGLMTVAPLGASARSAFARVREQKQILSGIFPAVHFGVLSMGMSEDFEDAILEGATEVRIGSALFGPRAPR